MAQQKTKDDYRSLSGPEKAAIMLMTLNEDQVAKIFELLEDDEVKEISQVMASLGGVSSSVIERILVDFAEQISSTNSLKGTYESTERLLKKVMNPDKASSIMEDIRGPAGRTMWDKLGNVNEETLANFLKNEYPQTVAVVLTKIKTDHAAKVLTSLPEGFAVEVMTRILSMESVQKEILDDIEKTLKTEFMTNLARTNKRDAHELMAEIFNNFDRSNEAKYMEALENVDNASAEKIKSLMFTFDDLQKLDPTSIQTVLRKIDKSQLGLALKSANDAIKDLFFSNMSERAAKILKEDMAAMGPVKLKEVEECQSNIIKVVKELAEIGEISISEDSEEELVY